MSYEASDISFSLLKGLILLVFKLFRVKYDFDPIINISTFFVLISKTKKNQIDEYLCTKINFTIKYRNLNMILIN